MHGDEHNADISYYPISDEGLALEADIAGGGLEAQGYALMKAQAALADAVDA